jgi:hypothetical protein
MDIKAVQGVVEGSVSLRARCSWTWSRRKVVTSGDFVRVLVVFGRTQITSVSVLSEYGTRSVGVRPLSLSFRLRFQGAALVSSSVAGLCPGRGLITSGDHIGVQVVSGRTE